MTKASKEQILESAIDEYEALVPLVQMLHGDVQILTTKKQDGVLSKTRITMINRLLQRARSLLEKEPSSDCLDLLEEDSIPQNADAMLVLGQYIAALRTYHSRHTVVRDYKAVWLCEGYREVL